jgi:hypothetical protein
MLGASLLRELVDSPLTDDEIRVKRAAEEIAHPDAVVTDGGAIVRRSRPTQTIQPPQRATWD